ncbi:MAG: hypothetical protein SF052_22460 [Bacteroidia bacterium]|nr:hypothetical protein [Bacteroidia bacterium]
MKSIRVFFLALGFWVLLPAFALSQTDDINVSAAFSSSIDLTVTSGANISFVVATLGEYTGGVSSPYNYISDFSVNSSVSFKVDLASTNFTDAAGNTLDAGNFGFRILDNGTYAVGVNHLLLGDVNSPSAVAVLGPTTEVVTASGSGNAGPSSANAFRLQFELGTPAVRAISGLPTLLDQNIIPGTYTGVVTLTASAMP